MTSTESELKELGFEPIGLFTVDKMRGVNLSAFINTAEQAYA